MDWGSGGGQEHHAHGQADQLTLHLPVPALLRRAMLEEAP